MNIKSPKLLWSGNFSSGSLKVPGISKYDIVAYFVDNEYACIGTPAHGVGGYIHFGTAGKGGYYVYSFSYTSSNETIAITDSFKGVIDVDSSSSAAVQKIYGIA